MVSKLAEFEESILSMVLAGKSYVAIGKFLTEAKGCKTDGPAVYRWLKSRQRKLLARQALVHPTVVQTVIGQSPLLPSGGGPSIGSKPVATRPVAPQETTMHAPMKQAMSIVDFDKLMLETKETKSILGKKR